VCAQGKRKIGGEYVFLLRPLELIVDDLRLAIASLGVFRALRGFRGRILYLE